MGKIVDMTDVRMEKLRAELETYQQAIRDAKEALAEAEAELYEAIADDDDYEEEYVSEEEIARENGFCLDEDCNWIPIDEEDW